MVATATLISRLLPENRFTHSFRFAETHPFFLPRGSTRAREFPFRAIARGRLAFRVSLSIPGVDRCARSIGMAESPGRRVSAVFRTVKLITQGKIHSITVSCARRIRCSLASRRFDTWRAARDRDNSLCASLTADKSRMNDRREFTLRPLAFLLLARPMRAPALIKQETFIETARVIGRENFLAREITSAGCAPLRTY